VAKGVNGTIDNSIQTTVQRNTQRNRNNNSGISFRLGVANEDYYLYMFQGSPVNNEFLRSTSANSRNDRGDLFDAATGGDIYLSFKKVVDPDASASGYLFTGEDPAYLNYNHPQNPFIENQTLDLNTLQSEEPVNLEDNASNISHYRGVPNPIIPDISSPGLGNASDTQVEILKNVNIFGSTSNDYRKITDTSLVTNAANNQRVYTETIDTIGQYFSRNY
jgi:hypothetical protein